MLVWDSFKCHISDAIKEQLKQCNTLMSVIPRGCTKFLQPLDVCINKLFKVFFCKLYDKWLHKKDFEYTKGENIKAPSHLLQIQTVIEAWKKVLKDAVRNLFDVCSIMTSNAAKISCLKNGNADATNDQSDSESTIEDVNVITDDDITDNASI